MPIAESHIATHNGHLGRNAKATTEAPDVPAANIRFFMHAHAFTTGLLVYRRHSGFEGAQLDGYNLAQKTDHRNDSVGATSFVSRRDDLAEEIFWPYFLSDDSLLITQSERLFVG
jgi:hypothetical protein